MIQAELVLKDGLLKSCRISGHAGAGPKGSDIVCAAVSVLARTALMIISERKDIKIQGGHPERGHFWMDISVISVESKDFLDGVGTFLKQGLISVSREFPDFCVINIEEIHDGS